MNKVEKGIAGAMTISLVIGGTGIAYLSFCKLDPNVSPPPLQFFLSTILSFLVLGAVVLQLLVYVRMSHQNEKLISSTEASAEVARQAFHIGESAHLGVFLSAVEDIEPGYSPKFQIGYLNGGKTPAWQVFSRLIATIEEGTDSSSTEIPVLFAPPTATFIPPGERAVFVHRLHTFRLTPHVTKIIADGHARLVLAAKVYYLDFRSQANEREFKLVWDPAAAAFREVVEFG